MRVTMSRRYITQCAAWLGGYEAAGRVCGTSGKAVQKWAKQGRLPRTEATGETNYAERMAKASPRIDGQKLLATVYKRCRPVVALPTLGAAR